MAWGNIYPKRPILRRLDILGFIIRMHSDKIKFGNTVNDKD